MLGNIISDVTWGVSGLLTSDTLAHATQPRLIRPWLVSQQQKPEQLFFPPLFLVLITEFMYLFLAHPATPGWIRTLQSFTDPRALRWKILHIYIGNFNLSDRMTAGQDQHLSLPVSVMSFILSPLQRGWRAQHINQTMYLFIESSPLVSLGMREIPLSNPKLLHLSLWP